jgi:hypothetical protein
VLTLAGVPIDEEFHQSLANIVATPDIPITDGTTTEVPADDLPGFIAREIGLDPDRLSDAQRADITWFITYYTL